MTTLDPNNTNFSTRLYEEIKRLNSPENIDPRYKFLRYHQNVVRSFLSDMNVGTRGLLVAHEPGTGKSLIGAAISVDAVENPHHQLQPIILLTKSLQPNFKKGILQYMKLRSACDPSWTHGKLSEQEMNAWINLKFSFVSMNAGNMMRQMVRVAEGSLGAEYNKAVGSMLDDRIEVIIASGSLDNKLLIVDEAHNLFRAMTNNSSNAIQLYNMIMRAKGLKLVFLTGTPCSNDPFELVPCMNMLAGKAVLPEDYDEFVKYFVDEKRGLIKNKDKFQNRIMGLVSYVTRVTKFTTNTNVDTRASNSIFPTVLPRIIEYIPMDGEQYAVYALAREKELEESKRVWKRSSSARLNKPKNEAASSYRQQSRQLSNYCPPKKFRETKFSDINVNEIEDSDITSGKLTALMKVLAKMPSPGYLYSQFVSAGGLSTIVRALKLNGYELTDLQSVGEVINELQVEEKLNGDVAVSTDTTNDTTPTLPHSGAGQQRAYDILDRIRGIKVGSGWWNGGNVGGDQPDDNVDASKPARNVDASKPARNVDIADCIFSDVGGISGSADTTNTANNHVQLLTIDNINDVINDKSIAKSVIDILSNGGFGFYYDKSYIVVSIIDSDATLEYIPDEHVEKLRAAVDNELRKRGHTKYIFSVYKCDNSDCNDDTTQQKPLSALVQRSQQIGKSDTRDVYMRKLPNNVTGGDDANNTNDTNDDTIDPQFTKCTDMMSMSYLRAATPNDIISGNLDLSVLSSPNACYVIELSDGQSGIISVRCSDDTLMITNAMYSNGDPIVNDAVYRDFCSRLKRNATTNRMKLAVSSSDVAVIGMYVGMGFTIIGCIDGVSTLEYVFGGGNDGSVDTPTRKKYFAVISGQVKPEIRDQIVRRMNQRENTHGELLSLLLISATGAEGLDLKSQRFCVIYEPYWVHSRLDQVEARGARADSHIMLPEDQQNFQPIMFISVAPTAEPIDYNALIADALLGNVAELNKHMTTDLELYYRSIKFASLIKSFTDALKEVSIECGLIDHSDTGIVCRMCTPNGQRLYTDNIAADIRMPNPCVQMVEESVSASEIIVDGRTYYYSVKDSADTTHFHKYIIYEYNKQLDSYVEMTPDNDLFGIIMEKLIQNEK